MTDIETREIKVNEHTYIEIDGAAGMHVDTAWDDLGAPSEYFDLTEWDAKVILTRKPKVYPAGTVVRGRAVGHYVKQVDGKWRYLPDDRLYASGDPDGKVTYATDASVTSSFGTVVYEPGSDA